MKAQPLGIPSSLRGTRLALAIFVGVAFLLALGRALTYAYVEILWHGQSGYSPVFWRRVLWGWSVRSVAGLAVGLLVFFNLRVAAQTLGGIQIRRRFGNLEISEQLPKQYVNWAMVSAAVLLGLWFGASIPMTLGQRALLLANAPEWGVVDPIHGLDLSFFVFWLPVLDMGFIYTLTATFLIFTLATAGYAATGALSWRRGRVEAHVLARLHLGIILAVFFVLLAGRLWLGRYDLLLDGNSDVQGIFGFTDDQARLPALQTLTVISLAAAAGSFWGAWRARPILLVSSLASVVLGTVIIREGWPSLVQNFRVEPNELVREEPYIEHSLEFTRLAYGLDDLDRRDFTYVPDGEVNWGGVGEQFSGLPVWNRSALLPTFTELEAAFDYYQFADVTISRYPGQTGPVPIALAVREVAPSGIPDQNWQNVYLRERFVAGQGGVASLATRKTAAGRPEMLITGIPPERSTVGAVEALELERPNVFFGTAQQRDYAIATPSTDQFLAPDGQGGAAGVDYPDGIPLSSTLRTALLAWRFGEPNILFSSELSSDSRLIYKRRVAERADAIAPWLHFPEIPYPVIADGRIVWILEGFTATGYFPLSTAAERGSFGLRSTYVRNSFKVTVDAVTGQTDFYRVPVDDPLADAFEAAYPELIKPISDMPGAVKQHIRYSNRLLSVQSRVLLQYHQESPAAFHGQQDVWAESQELSESTSPVPYRPEYGLYRLDGDVEPRFQLTNVFVPLGRQNLTAVLVGRTDGNGVPELVLIDVPVEDLVPGPRQVEALVEQDPQISQQLSLWRTGGSRVWTGHLHLVPVDDRFFYMEPIFLAAEEDAIPELRRFVVSDGVRVAMTETLDQAIASLAGNAPLIATANTPEPAAPTEGPESWPAAALELLAEAEASARAGNWQAYGEALARLRTLLEALASEPGGR